MKFVAEAQVRSESGKGPAREIRRMGKIPAILYGQGESHMLVMEPKAVQKILVAQGGSTGLISLQVKDGNKEWQRTAVIQSYQSDPLTEGVLHVDLFAVAMDKPVRVKVQVHLVGEAPIGVRRDKGVLHHGLRELHIECLPGDIPDQIDVDASALLINDGIFVRDVQVGTGIKVHDDPDAMVVNVSAPMSEAKLAAMLTTEAGEVSAAPAAAAAAPAAEKGKTEAPGKAAPAKAGESKK
jgi:large subunit ribosomal protein L25